MFQTFIRGSFPVLSELGISFSSWLITGLRLEEAALSIPISMVDRVKVALLNSKKMHLMVRRGLLLYKIGRAHV